jgi:hypothetical protein
MASARGRSTSAKGAPKGGVNARPTAPKKRATRPKKKADAEALALAAERTTSARKGKSARATKTSARDVAAKKTKAKKTTKASPAPKRARALPARRQTSEPPRARANTSAKARATTGAKARATTGAKARATTGAKARAETPAKARAEMGAKARARTDAKTGARAHEKAVVLEHVGSVKGPATTSAEVVASAPPPMPRSDELLPMVMGRMMELHWGDEPSSRPRVEGLVQRWVKRGDALLRHLAEHGAGRHEYRADLKEGRFVWLAPDGQVSAEAEAQVLCRYERSTSVLSMAWADPLTRHASVHRLDGMPKERDEIDEEGAWRVAMHAAELAKADYLYRVTTPHAYYFLALKNLSFSPHRRSFTPSTPVGLVLRGIAEIRRGIESRAEPTEVVRSRLSGVGRGLLHEADYVYRETDWVARLERAGRCLVHLAERLPRGSYSSVAAGRTVDEWLDREEAVSLLQALSLLEDEWALFA